MDAISELKEQAKRAVFRTPPARRGAPGGAVTAIQRFGSALNLNVHFHTLAVQGVFVVDAAGGLRFVTNPEPSDLEVAKLLPSISRRAARLAEQFFSN
jgi:hypothetical protein